MKINIVGGSNREWSRSFDAQRSINLYPVADQTGREVSALYNTPGLAAFTVCAAGPIRGEFPASNGRAFVVSGASLYEVYADGTNALRGTLDSASSIVTMEENGLQLAIADGTDLYIFTYLTNVFAKVTDVDLLKPVGTVTFIDGYFIINQVGTGKFQISKLYDGLTWAALDFATAESSPDNLVRVFNQGGALALQGETTTEFWGNTGSSIFPFERISGAKMDVGVLSAFTSVATDNSLFFVGKDKFGKGQVYRSKGYQQSQRISTDPIDLLLQAAPTPETLRAYTYQEKGHPFYVITGGGLETSPVYDISTNIWHERAYFNPNGQFEPHLGIYAMFAFGKQLVGSRRDGTIYDMSLDYADDAGEEIVAERTFQHYSDENKLRGFPYLEIVMEVGSGPLTGQGSDPKATLQISKNAGKTYSEWQTASIGKTGEYNTRVIFRRLGQARVITFRIRVTDPVRRAWIGSYIDG